MELFQPSEGVHFSFVSKAIKECLQTDIRVKKDNLSNVYKSNVQHLSMHLEIKRPLEISIDINTRHSQICIQNNRFAFHSFATVCCFVPSLSFQADLSLRTHLSGLTRFGLMGPFLSACLSDSTGWL